MLQRIQSVYLSIAFLALVVLFFFPMASFLSEEIYLKFYVTNVRNLAPGGPVPFSALYNLPLLLAMVAVTIMTLMCIFLYKNRIRQIQVTNIAVMLNILSILAILFIYIPLVEKRTGLKPDYASGIGIYLPIVSLLFLVLANRAIKRDEKLVRSSDRLR